MEARSATKVPEKELVKWAFGIGSPVPWLAPWLFEGANHVADFEVGLPVLASGDRRSDELDVLLWPIADPSQATVIEAKRVRVDASTSLTEQVGGLENVREGMEQCEAHFARGFRCVYLAAFVQVDARMFSGGYWQGGLLPQRLLNLIREEIRSAVPNPAIGLLVFQQIQPVDEDALLGGSFGLIDSRVAIPQQQHDELTIRIREFAADTSRSGRTTFAATTGARFK